MKSIAQANLHSVGPNYHQHISTGHGHQLDGDEPGTAGGANAGPSPYELLLASLGSCTAITLQMYAQKKGWEIGKLGIKLNLLKDRDGNTKIERELSSSAELTEAQWVKLVLIAGKTPVTRTIRNGAEIITTNV